MRVSSKGKVSGAEMSKVVGRAEGIEPPTSALRTLIDSGAELFLPHLSKVRDAKFWQGKRKIKIAVNGFFLRQLANLCTFLPLVWPTDIW